MFCLTQELSSRVKYADVVKRFEKIAAAKDTTKKAEILSNFYKAIFKLQKQFGDEEGSQAVRIYFTFLKYKIVFSR